MLKTGPFRPAVRDRTTADRLSQRVRAVGSHGTRRLRSQQGVRSGRHSAVGTPTVRGGGTGSDAIGTIRAALLVTLHGRRVSAPLYVCQWTCVYVCVCVCACVCCPLRRQLPTADGTRDREWGGDWSRVARQSADRRSLCHVTSPCRQSGGALPTTPLSSVPCRPPLARCRVSGGRQVRSRAVCCRLWRSEVGGASQPSHAMHYGRTPPAKCSVGRLFFCGRPACRGSAMLGRRPSERGAGPSPPPLCGWDSFACLACLVCV